MSRFFNTILLDRCKYWVWGFQVSGPSTEDKLKRNKKGRWNVVAMDAEGKFVTTLQIKPKGVLLKGFELERGEYGAFKSMVVIQRRELGVIKDTETYSDPDPNGILGWTLRKSEGFAGPGARKPRDVQFSKTKLADD